jgi:3',5'-cyclic AMP phosphodiesterase CpdA
MRTIVHLSDLHFGRTDDALCEALTGAVRAAVPDVVVISGDLTQRARNEEFAQAHHFLETLPTPQIIVPGNHDVPLYNVFKRAFAPLARYKRHITGNLEPFYADEEIAIAGINTARSLTFKNGRINAEQLKRAAEQFTSRPPDITRIIVTHHPFEGRSVTGDEGIVGRARMALEAFSRTRVDVILSGHLHLNRVGESAERYDVEGYSALLIQAGTAISTRRREETNSFNVIRIDRPKIGIECQSWGRTEGFATTSNWSFRLGPNGWISADVEPIIK